MNFDIVAEQDGRIVIEADDLFMEETLNNVSPNLPPEYRNFVALNLGRLDPDKTFVEQVRNYPKKIPQWKLILVLRIIIQIKEELFMQYQMQDTPLFQQDTYL